MKMVSSSLLCFLVVVLLCSTICTTTAATMAKSDYIVYKDPKQPMGRRIRDLMSRMTLEEKIGQMTQLDRGNATPRIMRDYGIGSVLSGGGSVPKVKATPRDWVKMVNKFQKGSLSSRLGIPYIYGIDAVHGHNNVYKATIFPHNIGLGVTRFVSYCFRIYCYQKSLLGSMRSRHDQMHDSQS